jgi:CheY-like chemotaxis protein
MECTDGSKIQHHTLLNHPAAGFTSGNEYATKRPVVLLAEDEEVNILYVRYVYSKLDIDLIVASSGTEAVEMCRKNPDIALVLMDIRMPEMDGIEATKEIRRFSKDMPIFALTAYGLSGEESSVLAAGCTGYLTKPINRETLVSLINKFIFNQQ